jgi:hypothetical protein
MKRSLPVLVAYIIQREKTHLHAYARREITYIHILYIRNDLAIGDTTHIYRIYNASTGLTLARGPYQTNQHRRRPRHARGDLARCRGTCHWCCLTIPIGHSGWSIMTVYTHWIVPSIDDGSTASSTYTERGLYKYSNINRITITYLYRLCTTCNIRKEMPLYYCPASDVRRGLFIFARILFLATPFEWRVSKWTVRNDGRIESQRNLGSSTLNGYIDDRQLGVCREKGAGRVRSQSGRSYPLTPLSSLIIHAASWEEIWT